MKQYGDVAAAPVEDPPQVDFQRLARQARPQKLYGIDWYTPQDAVARGQGNRSSGHVVSSARGLVWIHVKCRSPYENRVVLCRQCSLAIGL